MDAVAQGQLLLDIPVVEELAVASAGIIVEPVSAAGLPQVAEASVAAGVGWVVSNAHVDYLTTLRRIAKVAGVSDFAGLRGSGENPGAAKIGAILPGGGSVPCICAGRR